MSIRILHGDCRDVLRTLPDAAFAACVTDAPYELGFMGKGWDRTGIANDVDMWAEVLRVLKHGAHLAAFGGTRTFHRMACAIEDAGFEIRDCLMWLTAQGFPKGLNVVNQLIKLGLWQLPEHVPLAVQISASIRAPYGKAKEPIAVALAQIRPAGDLALITEIGEEVALHVPTAMWPFDWMERIGLSTTLSSSSELDDVCEEVSRSIIGTANETIIGPKTWNWLIGLHTSAITTQCSVTIRNGSEWPAITATTNLTGERKNRSAIPIVTALGNASWNPVARFRGFNVALKPAYEPIILARKPLAGTVAANVLGHGCGALNIDACRVATGEDTGRQRGTFPHSDDAWGNGRLTRTEGSPLGRWPANVMHDGSPEVEAAFAAFGERASGGINGHRRGGSNNAMSGCNYERTYTDGRPGDTGTASRFFFTAKADASDRAGSKHPTVKPTALMRWLVQLVTPPGGAVLDPFAGSGSTGLAADQLGFDATLIEQDAEYVVDIRRKIVGDVPLFAEVI